MTQSHFLKQTLMSSVLRYRNFESNNSIIIMGKKLSLILVLGLLTFGNLNAQGTGEAKEITLEQAIEMALANNPQIQRALLAIDDADQLVKIAYGEVFPDITSSLGYTRNVEIPVQFVPGDFFGGAPGTLVPIEFGTDNNWQGGFTVSQNIFKGEALVALKSSAVFKEVQKENFLAVSQQVITQTRIAYYSVLVAKEQLRLQNAQIERLETNLKENEARAEAGIVDDYDVLRLRVQLSNQKPQQIEAQYAVAEAYRDLNVVLGIPVGLGIHVLGDLNTFDIFTEEAQSTENQHIKTIDRMNPFDSGSEVEESFSLLDNRGDLRILEANLSLKQKEMLAVRSRFLPTLTASYNLQWTAAEPDAPTFFENNARFQTIGLNLSFPLFQGFKRVADLDRVKIQYKDLEEQKRQTELVANNELVSTREELNRIYETAPAREQALDQANEGYERAKKRFENGLGSQLEVTEAEIQVREAEVNYALMVFNYLTAKAQYDLAAGQVPYTDN